MGALHADTEHGKVRSIDSEKCEGCMECVNACPYRPGRIVWHSKESLAKKCDLCAGARYHWDEKGGGPAGAQACVEVCPVGAIRFSKDIPRQDGDKGYNINLRDKDWVFLGYPMD